MAKLKKKRVATSKPLFQWCIRETYVNEVLDLPKDIDIEKVSFEIGFSLKRVVSAIPKHLRALGVTSLREPSTSMEAFGVLEPSSRTALARDAKTICRELQLDFRHMRVRRMVVSYKGTKAFFTRMTKNMDIGAEDKTRQIKVLGLVKHEGTDDDLKQIIKTLTAKKIHCVYSVKPVTTVVCSE